jgi:hypothetical protein
VLTAPPKSVMPITAAGTLALLLQAIQNQIHLAPEGCDALFVTKQQCCNDHMAMRNLQVGTPADDAYVSRWYGR